MMNISIRRLSDGVELGSTVFEFKPIVGDLLFKYDGTYLEVQKVATAIYDDNQIVVLVSDFVIVAP